MNQSDSKRPRNCMNIFITGAGRSGTSALAGLLAKSDLFMGENLYPPRDANPKGFFESPDINQINDSIIRNAIADYIDSGPREARFPQAVGIGHAWLTVCPPDMRLHINPTIEKRIEGFVKHAGFCYKDPRFLLTLPVWLKNITCEPKILCAVRHPGEVVFSVVKECLYSQYLHNFVFSIDILFLSWTSSYLRFLESIWLYNKWPVKFVMFDSLIDGTCVNDLEDYLGTFLDRDFLEPSLKRSERLELIPDHAKQMIELLEAISNDRSDQGIDIAASLESIRKIVLDEIAERSESGYECLASGGDEIQLWKTVLSESLRTLNRAEKNIHELERYVEVLRNDNDRMQDQLLDLRLRVDRLPKILKKILGLQGFGE